MLLSIPQILVLSVGRCRWYRCGITLHPPLLSKHVTCRCIYLSVPQNLMSPILYRLNHRRNTIWHSLVEHLSHCFGTSPSLVPVVYLLLVLSSSFVRSYPVYNQDFLDFRRSHPVVYSKPINSQRTTKHFRNTMDR